MCAVSSFFPSRTVGSIRDRHFKWQKMRDARVQKRVEGNIVEPGTVSPSGDDNCAKSCGRRFVRKPSGWVLLAVVIVFSAGVLWLKRDWLTAQVYIHTMEWEGRVESLDVERVVDVMELVPGPADPVGKIN